MSGPAALLITLPLAALGGTTAALAVGRLLVLRDRPPPSRVARWGIGALGAGALLAVGLGSDLAAGWLARPAAAVLAVALTWAVVVAAATDVLARLVPDPLSLGTLVAVLGLLAVDAALGGDVRPALIAVAVTAAVVLVLALPALLHRARTGRSALGGGDRKFVPVVLLGLAVLAPRNALEATVVAAWSAGLHAIVLVVRAGGSVAPAPAASGSTAVPVPVAGTLPFAPHVALGTLVALLVG
ncbi:MAG: hypothetical protein RLZZ272_1389 [Actinomycetota bacterium]